MKTQNPIPAPNGEPRRPRLTVRTQLRAGALPAPVRPRGWSGDIEIGHGI